MISVLKFITKVIPKLMNYINQKHIENLVKNLHYISMYYGLSSEARPNNDSFLHRGVYQNKLKPNSRMHNLLKEISFQPSEIRTSIRK